MDRMVIQHTTTTNNNSRNQRNQRYRVAPQQTQQQQPAVVLPSSNIAPLDPFTEITDFVHQLYKELVAQKEPHAFNDFSCVFCDAAYFHLSHLTQHLESVHRHQVLNGTFQLQSNFEEIIRARILQGIATNQQQPLALDQSTSQSVKMESLAQAPPGHMYQCAKCFATFGHMDEVTQHVAHCAMNYGYAPQQQQQQQTHQMSPQQPLEQHSHHHQQQQQQSHHIQQHHQQQQVYNKQSAASVIQQQHLQQHYEQPQHQLSVPVVETPTTVPIRHKIYGCARCGLRFRVVRELVVHLHGCLHDTFHDKAQYLTPDLWLQAPEGQHIVINEPESNTTLNTTGLWLMSNDVVSSPDIVSKGFWVMPPNPNEQDVPNTPIKNEPIAAVPPQPEPTHSLGGAHNSPMSMPYDNYQVAATSRSADVPQVPQIPDPPSQWKKQSAPRKMKTLADENKRKRGSRAKAPAANHNGFVDAQQAAVAMTSGLGSSQQQQQHNQQLHPLPMYTNGDEDALAVQQIMPTLTPATKRKRYDQHQIVPDYLQTGVEIDLDSQNYMIDDFNSNSAQRIANPEQHHQTQHIITKDGLLYEQLDYDYSTASVQSDQTPIKIESTEGFANSQSSRATPKSTRAAAPQQHFKKKMQLQARSAAASAKAQSKTPAKVEVIDDVEVEAPPQILAIIANAEDLEDLSHLDKPIVPEQRVHSLNAKQTDYIGSYCSFLKSRTHK